jgi:Cysteine-rich secretory protein family
MADSTLPVLTELGFDTQLIDLINQERAKVGANPLSAPDRIDDAADAHALDMATNNNLSLSGSDGSTPNSRIKDTGYLFANVGETIAIGDDAAQVVQTWMNDPTQRSLILNPTFQDTGVGTVLDNNGKLFWSEVFGGPDPAPADPMTPPADPMTPPADPMTPPADPMTPPADPMTPPADPMTASADPLGVTTVGDATDFQPSEDPVSNPDDKYPMGMKMSFAPKDMKNFDDMKHNPMFSGHGKKFHHASNDPIGAPTNPMGTSDMMGAPTNPMGMHHHHHH